MKKSGILFVIIFLLGSCKKETEEVKEIVTYDEPVLVELIASDAEILDKVYDNNYYYPARFYQETPLVGFHIYLNSRSINKYETEVTILHTNNKKQAKAWSEMAMKQGSTYWPIVQERETERYFEFKRVEPNNTNPKGDLYSRVHKSSYFEPVIDLSSPTRDLGVFKQRPITRDNAKQFVEYGWSSVILGVSGKVIATQFTELPNWYQHNIKGIILHGADFGLCDNVEVWNFDFFVHKRTGDVYSTSSKLKDIKGKCW